MRDPAGRLRFVNDRAIRELTDPGQILPLLRSAAVRGLVDDGLMVPFTCHDGHLESPRYRFVTHPMEWCDAQLHDGAMLTLTIGRRLLPAGHELKDASAWNIVFEGCAPRFCDHLSFDPLSRRQWWAFGQFCRHFIFPLALSAWRGQRSSASFMVYRDGVPGEAARRMLGLRGKLSRLMPLLVSSGGQEPAAAASSPTVQPATPRPLHGALFDYATWCLLRPAGHGAGAWAGYVDQRQHYTAQASQAKLAVLDRWLNQCQPHTVLDLGCNTGEFSRLALNHAQRVIAVDADHDCVQRLYQEARADVRLHPVLANLGDLHGGRGWAAAEFPGLPARLQGQADALLMLALNHHLHFSEGIPLDEIADLAAQMTTRHAVVELIDPADPMVQLLAAQRQRDAGGFTRQAQEASLRRRFEVLEREALPGGHRELLLLQVRP